MRYASLAHEDGLLRGAMGQLGFFDAERRLAALPEIGDPLPTSAGLMRWGSFFTETVVLTPENPKTGNARRELLDDNGGIVGTGRGDGRRRAGPSRGQGA